ncbi:MAG: hypothetical protein GXX79_14205 [Actinomycetales bacterium]|nr:hypothetical protein [Actinomycetales bacterium]
MPFLTTRFEDVATALKRCADGVPCLLAAVELLIGHRFWLQREDFLERFVELDVDEATGRTLGWVDWTGAVAGLTSRRLVCSDGQRQVLAIAASLAEGVPVDLRDAVCGLDGPTIALLVDVVAVASGHRQGQPSW